MIVLIRFSLSYFSEAIYWQPLKEKMSTTAGQGRYCQDVLSMENSYTRNTD